VIFPISPLMPYCDQSLRLVVAPLETTPSIIAPALSNRHIALSTSCANTVPVIY